MSANFRCVRPGCGLVTHFYDPVTERTVNIQGQAAHVHAASPNGPRHDLNLTDAQTRHIDNGTWLCANCATLIDRLPADYPPATLKRWQAYAVERIRRTGLGAGRQPYADPRGDAKIVKAFVLDVTARVLDKWDPGVHIGWEVNLALQDLRIDRADLGAANPRMALNHAIRNRQLAICDLAANQLAAMNKVPRMYEQCFYGPNEAITGHRPVGKEAVSEDEARYAEIRRLRDELSLYAVGPPLTLGDADW